MRLIPVIDIKEGRMVHAVGGLRDQYQPIKTKLFDGSDPQAAVSALFARGFRCFYLADLDAITKQGNNFDLINKLFLDRSITLWADLGIRESRDIELTAFHGPVSYIAGSETLRDLNDLAALAQAAGPGRIVFSLDIVGNQVLSPNDSLSSQDPVALARKVYELGIDKIIVIDLKSVGRKCGPNLELLGRLKRGVPQVDFYPGGGVRDGADLVRLEQLNVAGALVATALYSGSITLAAAESAWHF